MPPWRDPPPGRCCYVSLASKFPFSCYSKGPLRELPGAPQNDARAGVCSRPASASRGRREAAPAPRRAGFAPRLRPRYRGGRRRPGAAPRRRARAAPPRRRPRDARPWPPPGLNRAAGPQRASRHPYAALRRRGAASRQRHF